MSDYIDPPSDRRSDSVAIPRKAVTIATGMATAFIIGVSTIFYNLLLDNVRINGRLDTLELFGPKSGERFTWADGEDIKEQDARLFAYIQRVDQSVIAHHAKAEHEGANRRLVNCETWRLRHEAKHDEIGDEIHNLRMNGQ